MIVGIGFSKRLADRFGKRDVFGVALLVSTCFCWRLFYSPTSIGLVVVSYILHGSLTASPSVAVGNVADVADWSE